MAGHRPRSCCWLGRGTRWVLAISILLSALVPGMTRAAVNLPAGVVAIIADANGELVRLRQEPRPFATILAAYPEGTEVVVLDGPVAAPDDGSLWYRVQVSGQAGYMAARYLAPAGLPAGPTQVASPDQAPRVVTGTAVIVNTDGDPIRCRAEPSTSAEIITRLFEGDSVELLGSADGSWQPVRCGGRPGFVHTDFIGNSASGHASPVVAASAGAAVGTAMVAGTNGDGLRCRSRAGFDGDVITVFPEGTVVSLRGNASDGWQPVICAGQNGFAFAQFLVTTEAPGNSHGAEPADVSSTGVVQGTNGDGVRCRAAASFSGAVITVLAEGTEVALRGRGRDGWQPVTCAGQSGWIYAEFIGPLGSPSSEPAVPPRTSLVAGEPAIVAGTNGDGVRLRARASFSGAVITVVREGQTVDVVAGSTGDWVAVSYRGSQGFIHMDYLVRGGTASGSASGGSGGLGAGDRALVTDHLRLRTGASFLAPVLGIAPPGTVVAVTGPSADGFYPVSWDSVTGYMHGDYLAWTDAPLSPRPSGVGGVRGDAGSGPGTAAGQAMVDFAMRYLGYPYVWATRGPDTFDCSGFTYWVVLNTRGIDITAGTWHQQFVGRPVPYGQLEPGDLVFFQNTFTWGLSHVGIYIGNNQFIHAENEQTGVVISRLDSPYYATRWYGARRL